MTNLMFLFVIVLVPWWHVFTGLHYLSFLYIYKKKILNYHWFITFSPTGKENSALGRGKNQFHLVKGNASCLFVDIFFLWLLVKET